MGPVLPYRYRLPRRGHAGFSPVPRLAARMMSGYRDLSERTGNCVPGDPRPRYRPTDMGYPVRVWHADSHAHDYQKDGITW